MLVGRMERGRRGRGRGAQRLADEGLREEIRILAAHLEAVEAGRRRDLEIGDNSEEETEGAADGPEGESVEVRLLRSVLVATSKPKPKLLTYDGSLSIEVLLDWISEMDKYFECEEVSEDRKVKFAATKLKGHTALWWDIVQNERKRLNKVPIKTWSRMVAKLKGRFLLRDYQIALHRQIANNNEEGSTSKASGSVDRGDSARGSRSSQRGRGNGQGRGAGYQCYRCHKWGHRSFEYPEADQAGQRGTYVAQPEEVATPLQEAENAPEIGEALVLHKVLLKLVKEVTEQVQQKSLFRTICKSRGKCCKLIIDSGSTDNLVPTEMVEKLDLKRLKHPNPYRVPWLQKGHQLLVDEQSEVEFQIGRYKDRVVCDIMPMDVCHILLGKPWYYDRKVVHDGLTSCYKFVKDGIKHTLMPIKEEGTAETSELRTLLVSGKQFLKQVEDIEIGYAVVNKARKILLHTEVSDLPMEIQRMLQEFTDIVVDDLLDKLPPKRSISHHIDFVPRASLSNRAAYRMSPKDNEEIRK
eukprot:PITA_34054